MSRNRSLFLISLVILSTATSTTAFFPSSSSGSALPSTHALRSTAGHSRSQGNSLCRIIGECESCPPKLMNTSACKTYGNRRKLACLSLATESSKTGEPSYRLDSHTTGHSHDDDFSAGDDDAPNDRNDDEDWRTASDFPGGLDEETNGGDDIAAGFKGDEGDDDIFGLDGEEGTNEKVSSGGHTNAGEKVVTLVNSNPMVGETKMSTERLKEVTVAGEKFDTSDPDPKNIDDEEFKDTMRQPVTPRRRKAIVRRQEGAGGLQAGEVESWEECPKVVANEKKDYYEFVFCNIVLASISLAVLVQRHRKLAERQYGRLAARIGVTVFDGPAVASN